MKYRINEILSEIKNNLKTTETYHNIQSVLNLCIEKHNTYSKNGDVYFRTYEDEKNFLLLYQELEKYKLLNKYSKYLDEYCCSSLEEREECFIKLLNAISENEIESNNSIFIYG